MAVAPRVLRGRAPVLLLSRRIPQRETREHGRLAHHWNELPSDALVRPSRGRPALSREARTSPDIWSAWPLRQCVIESLIGNMEGSRGEEGRRRQRQLVILLPPLAVSWREGSAIWRRILVAIEELQRGRREDEAVN